MAFICKAETSDNNICRNHNYSRPRPNIQDLNLNNYDAGRKTLETGHVIMCVIITADTVSWHLTYYESAVKIV